METEVVILRINTLLNHIIEVLRDTNGCTSESLKEKSVLLRATCFSIGQIGEQMIKLEDSLKDKYPELPWKRARGMRNLIVHEYEHIDAKQVFSTIQNDLPKLKIAFEQIKSELESL